jgi:hypothetical protein
LDGDLTTGKESPKEIDILAGAEIRRGVFHITNRAKVRLAGTASEPCVFRDVKFILDLGGSLKANNAVFENCRFTKGGAWYSTGGHSTSWDFENCLFYKSPMASLSFVDYAYKFVDCAFVQTNMPTTHMKNLRGDWKQIRKCSFFDCDIPATVFWTAEQTEYTRCRFVPGSAPVWQEDLALYAFVKDPNGPSPEEVWKYDPAKGNPFRIVDSDQPIAGAGFSGACPIPEIRYDPKYQAAFMAGN